jgi:hypothetical protein
MSHTSNTVVRLLRPYTAHEPASEERAVMRRPCVIQLRMQLCQRLATIFRNEERLQFSAV